jgi:hypothetical protein
VTFATATDATDADAVRPTCDRQREVLAALRARGLSIRPLPGSGSTVVVRGSGGRTWVVHGGLRSLTLAEVRRMGQREARG